MKTIQAKLRAARKSATVWALAAGLALSEALPYVVDSLPLAREAFDEHTYRYIVRGAFLLGIVLRVRRVKDAA